MNWSGNGSAEDLRVAFAAPAAVEIERYSLLYAYRCMLVSALCPVRTLTWNGRFHFSPLGFLVAFLVAVGCGK